MVAIPWMPGRIRQANPIRISSQPRMKMATRARKGRRGRGGISPAGSSSIRATISRVDKQDQRGPELISAIETKSQYVDRTRETMTNVREKEQFLRFLRGRGQRVTGERLALFDEIFSQHGHIDAEELLRAMKARGLKISRATVYRNLDLLWES